MATQRSAILAFLAASAVGVMALALVSAGLVTTRTISNTGGIKAVGVSVYWDLACTNGTGSVNWGTLAPGATATLTVYVKNNGTIPVTLSIAYGNWAPSSASTYITPSWNRTGYVLSSGSVVASALTLTVSQNVTGFTTFSYDTTITGSE